MVTKPTEILPGMFVLGHPLAKARDDGNERTVARDSTPKGLAVIVGCSHPGGRGDLGRGSEDRPQNLHGYRRLPPRVMTPRPEVQRGRTLHDELKVERIAPGHCTSELGSPP
ncbi:MAG: hypothetical protein IPM01_30305 [Burkholderiaceae bacterium]|nr:hypothetical protein [Burkholderiaceae bacterium]